MRGHDGNPWMGPLTLTSPQRMSWALVYRRWGEGIRFAALRCYWAGRLTLIIMRKSLRRFLV
jgi:hypothetical protein